MAKCLGHDPANWSCPLSASCTGKEACEGRCYTAASCEAIKGDDAQGAAALQKCIAGCGMALPDGGGDGPGGDGKPGDGASDFQPTDGPEKAQQSTWYFPQHPENDVDILFVIDTSNSMAEEQTNLAANIPKLIEALKDPQGKLPDLHIGVITVDLGAGNYQLPSCETNGDNGKLQASPTTAGCTPPADPFIKHVGGVTNVSGGSSDPAQQVIDAFQCIATMGTGGCGFEQTLEAARRALDPTLNLNPGFVRPGASLAVVFLTDEDDCSAAKPQLYDPSDQTLGQLTSFRCFEHGFTCDQPDLASVGKKTSCSPDQSWLHKISDYVSFFGGLKPPGRLQLFAVAGPTDLVEVTTDASFPALKASCQTTSGKGVPALRLKALIDAFGSNGYINEGTDATGTQQVAVNICSNDFTPALRLLGKKMAGTLGTLGGQCLGKPPLTATNKLACSAGDVIGPGVTCQKSCLESVDCAVEESVGTGAAVAVPRCAAAKFADPTDFDCGGTCPCWRVVRKPECKPGPVSTPYGLEVLRKGQAAPGTVAKITCRTSALAWGSPQLAALPQCQ
jgi:hypothetical protein